MSKPKAPEPPDYAAAAKEQGTANVNSAIATNFLNQANQTGPYGSITYSYDTSPGQGYTLPDGTVIPRTTATTTLSPEQQRLLDQNTQISTNLNDLAIRGIKYVDAATGQPIDTSKFSPIVGNVSGQQFNGKIGDTSLPLITSAGNVAFQNKLDLSGVKAMPNPDSFMAMRDQITNAMLARLQPQIDRDREALRTRLANQGINLGSEAYGWDNTQLEKNINDLRIAALLAGNKEQQDLIGNQMDIHNQGFGEVMGQADLFNRAAAGAVQQNQFNAQLAADAAAQEFAREQAKLDAENKAVAGNFQQGLANAQLSNSARAQALQEADYLKNQPLNMLNALRSGNQVTTPEFSAVTAGSSIAPPPLYQATSDSYQAALDKYKAELAARSGVLGGIADLGGAAVGKWG